MLTFVTDCKFHIYCRCSEVAKNPRNKELIEERDWCARGNSARHDPDHGSKASSLGVCIYRASSPCSCKLCAICSGG